MNIFQLRYFVSVAQLENISKAADLLHLSQSSLSKSIAKLEAELGMPLFQRSGKHIVLNEQGRRFWEFSSMVLRELEFTIDDMNLLANGFGNKLKVGLCGANKIIMACMQQFIALHHETELTVTSNIEQLEKLRAEVKILKAEKARAEMEASFLKKLEEIARDEKEDGRVEIVGEGFQRCQDRGV